MFVKTVKFSNVIGLTADVTNAIVEKTREAEADIFLEIGHKKANAKNIIEIYSLGINTGDLVQIHTRDQKLMEEVAILLENRGVEENE